ncbi:MAG: hypothetical protein H6809_00830 [Phycisphaeraceae bacterium]|nr:hypothetical protein [Phycisphaeraceae bacterium]
MPSSTLRTLASIAGLAAIATASLAQPRSTRQDRAPEPPALRGPTVEDTTIPGTARSFSMESGAATPQTRFLNREVPMGEFLGAIRALNAPETPDDLALTPQQRETFADIVREHGRAMREHMAAHRDELVDLGQALGFSPDQIAGAERNAVDRLDFAERRAGAAARGLRDPAAAEGDAGPRGPRPEQAIRQRLTENATPEQRAAAERLREIRDAGPSVLEAQTQAWNVLTEPQQAFVLERLEQGRRRAEAQRDEMYVEEMAGRLRAENAQRPGRPLAAPGASQPAQPGSAAERLHRLIDRLSPEQQERLLQMLEARMGDRLDGAPQARPGQAGARRPVSPAPPTMDQIDVPTPNPARPF